MTHAEARIHIDKPIGTVSPDLHGHFVEQLFDCVNGGLFDAAAQEFRPEFIQKGAELGLELIRWPGGCFADAYHWRDGIGPRSQRPKTVTNRWGVDEVEGHDVGSHEFMDFCSRTGARAWINLNVGTGSPTEASEWMEYMTLAEGTDLAALRAHHGRPEPYAVEMWGIGNECWDCGGKFTPVEYAHAYRRFESALPRFPGLPRRFVIGGPDGNKPEEREIWTRQVLETLCQWRRPAMHALDLHFYTWGDDQGTGRAASFDANQFSNLIWRGLELEPVMLKQREIIDSFDPGIKLMVGEWGPWHPDAFGNRFWQPITQRDAVLCAATLDMFHRHADKLAGSTYTMLCNVLGAPFQTIDGRPYTTPVYDVFLLHKGHRGGASLAVDLGAEDIAFRAGDKPLAHPGASISATLHDRSLWVTAANLSPREDLRLALDLGGSKFELGSGQFLGADDLRAVNTPDGAGAKVSEWKADGPDSLHLPPGAVGAIRVSLV